MSMFSIPDDAMTDTKRHEMKDRRPEGADLTSAVNLMAHPMAGAAAMTALGFGFASQAFGMWMGAMTSAAEASQRLLDPFVDQAADEDALSISPKSAAVRARAATRTLIAEAQSVADGFTEAATRIVEDAEEVTDELVEAAAEIFDTSLEAMDLSEADAVAEPAELMPEDFRQPKAMERPAEPDDLKAISGIGPKLEAVLNGLGVWTFAQIAAWTPEEVAWVDDYLSLKGRIARDGWIGQAAALSGGTPATLN